MLNAVGREIPEEILERTGKEVFQGNNYKDGKAFQKASPKVTPVMRNDHDKMVKDIHEALVKCNAHDGMTVSFHHHFREGDLVVCMVMEEIHKMGFKNITLSASSLGKAHDALVPMIEDGTIVVEESCEGLEAIDLIINGGTIDVTASDDGLNAAGSSVDGGFGTAGADTLTVNGGTLTVNASGDGLDSNGALTINGGKVYVSGPTGDGNGTFDCDGVFTINGGVVLGTGSSGMLKTPTTDSKQNTISVSCTGSAGDTVEVKGADGNTLVFAVAPKNFTNVMFSTPDITEGETYTVYVNGTEAASETCSGVVSGATGMGSFGGGPGNMAPNGGMGGQMPNGNSDGTTPPEMPSGDSGITPPNGNGGTPPQMPGNTSDT